MKFPTSRYKHSMGANESRDVLSNSLIFHFVFVIVSNLFDFWRSLSHNKGLQSEIEANNKEDECVRKRLRFQDEQLERAKERQDVSADEAQRKYGKTYL